jgi:hypothetical protein
MLKSLLVGPSGITIARIVELVAVGLCVLSLLAGYTRSGFGFKSNAFILWDGSQADAHRRPARAHDTSGGGNRAFYSDSTL